MQAICLCYIISRRLNDQRSASRLHTNRPSLNKVSNIKVSEFAALNQKKNAHYCTSDIYILSH